MSWFNSFDFYLKYMCRLLPGNRTCRNYFLRQYPDCFLSGSFLSRIWQYWFDKENGAEQRLVVSRRAECRGLPVDALVNSRSMLARWQSTLFAGFTFSILCAVVVFVVKSRRVSLTGNIAIFLLSFLLYFVYLLSQPFKFSMR
ncbi:hypothetical protein KR222_005163 [Zaprionus bogoriensis]|nr:hypothetical protein KR222_005163 [Zaprionus bogoriensis]